MNCLPDTSAWSLLLRRRRDPGSDEDPVARNLRLQIEGTGGVFLAGIVYQEVLQGIRRERHRLQLIKLLSPFQMLAPTRKTHERAARLRDRCLRAGVTVSTVDVLIAQIAIDFGCVLLSTDRDFQMISKYSTLQVLGSGLKNCRDDF